MERPQPAQATLVVWLGSRGEPAFQDMELTMSLFSPDTAATLASKRTFTRIFWPGAWPLRAQRGFVHVT
jgi:hypothetical protein